MDEYHIIFVRNTRKNIPDIVGDKERMCVEITFHAIGTHMKYHYTMTYLHTQ